VSGLVLPANDGGPKTHLKVHILIATLYLPWPLIEGGRVAQYRTFAALRDACTFTLVVPVHSLEEEIDAKKFAGMFSNVKVRPVRWSPVVPPTLRTRAGSFASKLSSKISPPRKPDKTIPYYPFYCLSPDFVTAVEEELAKGCDIFQVEFADMLTLGPLMTKRVPSIFVHHQLHFVYARRFLEANAGGSVKARYITERMIREEEAYLNTFDSVIVFSEVDRTSLKGQCPALEINVSPFPSPEDPVLTALPFDKPARHFVFVASESHRPNADGLSWFMKNAWPEIKRRLPEASIEVIGKWSQKAQSHLPNHEDIHFLGFIPNLAKSLQNKIMIVPVWVGSGIRTKILAAWSSWCPVVTTTIGVEGLPGQAGEHFIVADDAPAFASACIELAQNVNQQNRIATNGLNLVQNHYSLAAVRKMRLDIYEKLLAKRRLTE
jgi:glycosyltransferase involved in cell wall biosynthesis